MSDGAGRLTIHCGCAVGSFLHPLRWLHVFFAHRSWLTRLGSAKLFRRVLGRGIRFGEALHPGPDDLRFAICNPTSLTNKADAFGALREQFNCHFIGASETSATQPVQCLARRQLRQLGYYSAFTTAAPSLRARADQQISLRGKARVRWLLHCTSSTCTMSTANATGS